MRILEELNHNAWPGIRWMVMDGWILRLSDGFTRRGNSVLPLYPGSLPLATRIAQCEELMLREGTRPRFRLFPEAEPASLDGELERRGYTRVADSTLRVLDSPSPVPPVLPAGTRAEARGQVGQEWMACFAAGRTLDERQTTTARTILERIVPEHWFIHLETGEGPAACALAVRQDEWAGISSVVVRTEFRGRGLGRAIMELSQAMAMARGARHCWLLVMDDNAVASGLYDRMGYRISHRCWAREKS
jgi:GNAT superfamily N-acetyltransferase